MFYLLQQFLMFLIRLYWKLTPDRWRRDCIFRVNCSRYVYDTTYLQGFIKGWTALKTRWKRCRPGYRVEWLEGKFCMRLADGYLANEEEIADPIVQPYKKALEEAKGKILKNL